MKKMFIITLTILLLAVGCGGATTGEPAVLGDIDVTQLPDTVDVQTVSTIQGESNVLVLDVREQWEYDEGHIPNVTHIPMEEIASRLEDIPQDATVILTCRSGNRSGQVTDFLREQGYDNVHNMAGGILAWEEAGLPVEK